VRQEKGVDVPRVEIEASPPIRINMMPKVENVRVKADTTEGVKKTDLERGWGPGLLMKTDPSAFGCQLGW
jgi:hypothetical protein